MELEEISKSEKDTLELGRSIGRLLKGGEVICLAGPLGAGKTCLARGILEGAGVRSGIRSPSFNIMYLHKGRIPVYHFDVYRLDDPSEAWELGLDEAVGGDAAVIIEWADRLGDWAKSHLYIEIFPRAEERLIRICDRAGAYRELLASVTKNADTRH
ncbi:MAG TPA: tRNA (adenosine(37)-N6)-threonylcarbamoyltransferase complex ATPase subunit type 1 TsaE [Firmicutes bacterium]|nr:tRNA (adenosine(37)-N6)-threonylcarbamoyltransferase complex ATPase subunit type 1 TsaE [Bacillota bacterium]